MEILKKPGYFVTASYRVLDYEIRQTDNLYLCSCGEEHFNYLKIIGPSQRPDYHVHFILSGQGFLQTGDVTHHLTRGQIFLLRPEMETTYWPDMEDPWTYAWITLNGTKAVDYLQKSGFPEGIYLRDSIFLPESFTTYIEQILLIPELTYANELKRTGLLYSVMGALIDSYTKGNHTASDHHYDYSPKIYVAQAMDYIHHNYSSMSINGLAAYIGINRSYLTSIFKKLTDQSPQEYLMKYRLEQACRLLTSTNFPIKEIASQIGYHDALTFSKMFKIHFGCSPQRYRTQQKN